MSIENQQLSEVKQINDTNDGSLKELKKGGSELQERTAKNLDKIIPKIGKIIKANIDRNEPIKPPESSKKQGDASIKESESIKEKGESSEKTTKIIDRGIIETKESSINLTVGKRVYQSIDEYNPQIDTKKDNTQKLQALFTKSREKSDTRLEAQIQPTSPEENKKIEEIIREVYLKNKPAIDKELGVTNLENLTPQQAAKISSLVTMSKLDYDNTQAINPNDTNDYLDKLSPEQQVVYKKDYYISKVIESLNTNKEFHSQNKNGYFKKVFNYLHSSLPKDFGDTSFDDMDKNSIVYANQILKDSGFGKERLSKEAILDNPTTTNIYASLSDTFNRNDSKTVSELLKDGKGVCRNYGAANEAIFNVLKGIQNPDNNRLKSSILTINTGNNSDGSVKANIADTENGTNGHLWNELQTIGVDGKVYVSQIDPTFSDDSEGSNINKVRTLDRTYERLLNDIANNTDNKDFSKVGPDIERYISKLEKKGGNNEKVSHMTNKLYKYYEGLGNKEGIERMEKQLISTKTENNIGTREYIIKNTASKDWKKAIKILGTNATETNRGLLDMVGIKSFAGDEGSLSIKAFDDFVTKNPDFLKLDKKGREVFINNTDSQYASALINLGFIDDDFINSRYGK